MNVKFLLDKIVLYRNIEDYNGEYWWDNYYMEAEQLVSLKDIMTEMTFTDAFPLYLLTKSYELDVEKAKADKQAVLDAIYEFILRMSGDHGQLGRLIPPILAMAKTMQLPGAEYRDVGRKLQGSLNSRDKMINAIVRHGNSPRSG